MIQRQHGKISDRGTTSLRLHPALARAGVMLYGLRARLSVSLGFAKRPATLLNLARRTFQGCASGAGQP